MQDSSLLRITDRHIGSLLCGAVSLLHSFRPRPAERTPEKILLIELFEMGAAVMMLPSIEEIRKRYPGAEIHCLTTSSCVPVWNALGAIERDKLHVIRAGSATKFVLSTLSTIWRLRRIRFDLIIDFELFMRVPALISGALKARRRAGFHRYDYEGLYRGSFYDSVSAYNQNSHISKNFLGLTRTALTDAKDSPNHKGAILPGDLLSPFLSRRPAPTVVPTELQGKRFVVVCPDVGKTLPMRNYPRPFFATLARELLSGDSGLHAVFIGTSSESETSMEIISQSGMTDRCVNLCGKTTFDELMAVIAGAELLITNDNGPAHFATLTGTRTLALFSTDSPFVYGPLGNCVIAYSNYHCSPCISAYNHKRSRCDNNKCLQAIPPDRLLALAKSVLEGSAAYRTINGQVPYLF